MATLGSAISPPPLAAPPAALPPSAGFALADQARDLADHVLERAVGRVELDRVRSRAQRRVLALLVLLVAQRLVAQHGAPVRAAEVARAAPGALLGACGEVDLQVGLRRHNRPDVASLGHPVPRLHQLAL